MIFCRFLFLALLHSMILTAAESASLPVAADKALERYQQSGTKAFLAWKQAVEKERAILIKSLESVLASEAKKKGNEAVVQALTARIESLRRDDWVVEAIKEQCAGSNDLLSSSLSEKEVLEEMAGIWYHKWTDPEGHPMKVAFKIQFDAKSKTVAMFEYDPVSRKFADKAKESKPVQMTLVEGEWRISVPGSGRGLYIPFRTGKRMFRHMEDGAVGNSLLDREP